ncbi:two component transcriptional regulator, winged helix family [Sulfobacillus acidophilus TPY]|uniref:Stage 0 sporulation protein A homolog n=1 Tax=Sulfobacillus acidophilus (strain ATCC 700253 / DSM 10332 / NAL) TaxID=679936 RepID=G8U0L1_SULAD|nr:two component transcriptional regulator, winged helix family [Sulfobacillus acidophilus TPY]AEW04233.1 two component transcriptional regulator, winged helix family [Sulfobacillus acidophilus DSM 10332]
MKVLLVEDDQRIATLLQKGLTKNGHVAETALTAREAYRRLADGVFDVMVLDVKLPDDDGFAVLERVRRDGLEIPVLMLTARDSVDDKVRGLSSGADDYLTKPFVFDELLARLQALVRRAPLKGAWSARLEAGPLVLDTLRGQVWYRETPVNLTARQLALLEFFLRHRGQIVTRDMLLDRVWDSDFEPMANVVDAQIARLRAKLDPLTGRKESIIQTVRGRGYRLTL